MNCIGYWTISIHIIMCVTVSEGFISFLLKVFSIPTFFFFCFQWECKTDMDNAYRFGQVEVSCEGYDYPEDPYILKGSCGVSIIKGYQTVVR